MGKHRGAHAIDDLRARAELVVRAQRISATGPKLECSEATLNELRLHQIELELQNEELRETQRSLEAARQRYRDLYDAAPVGYVTLDAAGRIADANKAAGVLLRTPADDLLGEPFTRFVFRDDQDALYHHRQRLVGGAPQVTELRMTAHDGEMRWVRLEELASASPDGVVSSRLVLSDITDQKNSELALLQTERLASVGLLAASVAHEINNPLTYVLLSVENLAEAVPKLQESIEKLPRPSASRRAEARLSRLVEECAAIAAEARDALDGVRRIDQVARSLGAFGRTQRIERVPVDVNACLERAAQLAHNELRFRATVHRQLGTLPAVLASEGRLCQVFLNLIVNAAHALDDRGPEANEIRLCTSTEDGEVVIDVVDTGSGISPENLRHLFKPFFTTKPAGKGSGLGLAILRGILDDLGGTITIENQAPRGARARVRIPAAPAARVPEVPGACPAYPLAASPVGGRLLVVDDERPIVNVIERHLQGDYAIVTADSGTAAREILQVDQAFDFILCDVIMPDLGGLDLHAWLAETNPALAARMIFMTGGVFLPAPARYLAGIKNLTLSKPFSKEDIRARLASARSRP